MHIQLAPYTRQRRLRLVQISIATLAALLLLLVTAGVSLACPVCFPPDKVTLQGAGIAQPVTITDGALLQVLSPVTFLDFEERAPVATPRTMLGPGYELIRYFKADDRGQPASFWTQGFDRFHYYPGATDQMSFVYYDGPLGDTMGVANTAKVGHWFRVSPSEDTLLRQAVAIAGGQVALLGQQQHSTTPLASTPEPVSVPGTFERPAAPFVFAALALALIPAMAGWVLWQRRRPRTMATDLGLEISSIEAPEPQEEADALPR